MRPTMLRGVRGGAGFAAVVLLLAAAGTWAEAARPYCEQTPEGLACPPRADAPVEQLRLAGGLLALGAAASGAAASAHVRLRKADPSPATELRLGWTAADRLMLGAVVLGFAGFAAGAFGLGGAPSPGAAHAVAWAGVALAGSGLLAAAASLFVRPTSGILQRWTAVSAIAIAGAASVFNRTALGLSGLG